MTLNYDGQTRRDETIVLDGGSFVGTVFENCVLEYNGGPPPNLERCKLLKGSGLALGGPAMNTMIFFVLLNWWSPETAKELYQGIQTLVKEAGNPSPKNS